MGIKATLIKPYARRVSKNILKWSTHALEAQERMMKLLVNRACLTRFGKDHNFQKIITYSNFSEQVHINDYEGIKPYIDRVLQGEKDVLWPGRPKYLAKTSGTTSGIKYIPITKESLPNHFGTARNALFHYAVQTGNFNFLGGKMIFLSGSPKLKKVSGIQTGRLSGIVNHQVPSWLRTNQLPTYDTNCIEDWEQKLSAIVDETINEDMRLISGIPPWVQMYYEWLLKKSGKSTIKALFPNLSVFVYGGVNYEPYRQALLQLMGEDIDSVETYPASEGFIAFQDEPRNPGLLLNVNSGIFFEFIPTSEYGQPNAKRMWLGEVEMGVNYVLIINNNAGLWGYDLGDTIEFVSLNPYRVRVTGRVKHYISAFGEHVISKEVEEALLQVAKEEKVRIIEFTVAPRLQTEDGGPPHHEWFVEFDSPPADLPSFEARVDAQMISQNIYYKDLIHGKILQPLKIRPMQKDAFRNFMKSRDKLGGQNKVPRLSNDRVIADELEPWIIR